MDRPTILNGLVRVLRSGLDALSAEARAEVNSFAESQQHASGCFVDRAGTADLYYTIFGLLLSEAMESGNLTDKIREFAGQAELNPPTEPVDRLCLHLVSHRLTGSSRTPGGWGIVRETFFNKSSIGLNYRLFLFFILLDETGRLNRLYRFLLRWILWSNVVKYGQPCTVAAAGVYLRHRLGAGNVAGPQQLMEWLKTGSGFSIYPRMSSADMLSTGVALFALHESGTDLRLLAPGCMAFIEGCYDAGAFLAGNGDMGRDVEYTFYGLLALGSLVNKDGKEA